MLSEGAALPAFLDHLLNGHPVQLVEFGLPDVHYLLSSVLSA